jgi:hypothetical protein
MFCVFQNETLTNITKEGYGSCYDLGKSLDTTKVGVKIITFSVLKNKFSDLWA